MATLARPRRAHSGAEVRTLIKRLVVRIRRHWPHARLVFRGDSRYGRPQAMAWFAANGGDYRDGHSVRRVMHGA